MRCFDDVASQSPVQLDGVKDEACAVRNFTVATLQPYV
jgi:hypothetical protein